MKNATEIVSVSRQLGKVSDAVCSLVVDIKTADDSELSSMFKSLLFDEVEHAQVLTLELTKLLAIGDEEETHADEGSVFAAGELTDTGQEVTDNENKDGCGEEE